MQKLETNVKASETLIQAYLGDKLREEDVDEMAGNDDSGNESSGEDDNDSDKDSSIDSDKDVDKQERLDDVDNNKGAAMTNASEMKRRNETNGDKKKVNLNTSDSRTKAKKSEVDSSHKFEVLKSTRSSKKATPAGDDDDEDVDDDDDEEEEEEVDIDESDNVENDSDSSGGSSESDLNVKEENVHISPKPEKNKSFDKSKIKSTGKKFSPKEDGQIVIKKLDLGKEDDIPSVLVSKDTKLVKGKRRTKDPFFDCSDSGDEAIEVGEDHDNIEHNNDSDHDENQTLENIESSYRQKSTHNVHHGMNAFSTTFVGSLRSEDMMKCSDSQYKTNQEWKRLRQEKNPERTADRGR